MDDLTAKLKDIAKRRVSKSKSDKYEDTEYAKFEGASVGSNLTHDEIEFGRAMQNERERLGRYLEFADVLRVAKQLGYSKE